MKEFGRILVLIDDLAILGQVEPHFSELPDYWKVHVTQTAENALCLLDQVPFELIFVELKAGPFASLQFLHQVWTKHPLIIRFLLADSLPADLMVSCALGSHQVLQKPMDAAVIGAALERAKLVDRLFQNKELQSLVSKIRTFPSRPTVYVEVMKELRSSTASSQTVGELVARDLAISSKLLQITNSAFFGFGRPISAPADAVLLLGMETTAALVLGIEAFSRLDNVKLLYFSTDQVWKHCQCVANVARALTNFMTNDESVSHDAYTAALLHDIGKLALAVNLQEPYRDALNIGRENNLPAWEVERQAFGATHAEAGAYLLSLWGLPARVIEAVAGHHLPARELSSEFTPLTALHLANAFENSFARERNGESEIQLDLDYPSELRIAEQFEVLRDLARQASRPNTGSTQFIRKVGGIQTPANAAPDVQAAANSSPNGFWSRFRSLLAT
jgi:putative nucleotidyltransferase with HDIG domain